MPQGDLGRCSTYLSKGGSSHGKHGPWTRAEIWTAVILVAAFAMFITGQLHHVPDAATCLMALSLLHLTGVLNFKDINPGISWDLVVFLGSALSLPAVFGSTGVSKWLASLVVPLLGPVASAPFLFIFAVVIILFIWCFVDIATMIPTILAAEASALGCSPGLQDCHQECFFLI